jgi:phosphosulfolactate synthase
MTTRGGPTVDYLRGLGVADLPARTCPFDPGYDPLTLEGHLEQSAHLMASLKLSMACWLIASGEATRRKIAAASRSGVTTVTGGGPFEIAVAQDRLDEYLDLCAGLGIARIECGEGFAATGLDARRIVRLARGRGLEVQFELGEKQGGSFSAQTMDALLAAGSRWLDAGAVQLVVEARESAKGVGLFDDGGRCQFELADRFVRAFGFEVVTFEAPTKSSQFGLLDHFGPAVRLGNVRLEELLRVEIYRRGLHADAFANERLRPAPPVRVRR